MRARPAVSADDTRSTACALEFCRRLWPHAIGAGGGRIVVRGDSRRPLARGRRASRSSAGTAPQQTPAPPTFRRGSTRFRPQLQALPADAGAGRPPGGGRSADKTLSDSLAASIAGSTRSRLRRKARAQHADAASAAAKSATENSVQRSDLDALASRIAALESAVKALSATTAQRPASADDRAARAAVAAEALRAVVERGAPYQAELAAVKSLGADPSAVAPLEPFAASGVPSAAALAHELAQLTPALAQARPHGAERRFLPRPPGGQRQKSRARHAGRRAARATIPRRSSRGSMPTPRGPTSPPRSPISPACRTRPKRWPSPGCRRRRRARPPSRRAGASPPTRWPRSASRHESRQ